MKIISAPIVFTDLERNRVLAPGAVAFNNQEIVDIGPPEILSIKYPQFTFTKYDQGLLTPGIINLHHHLYSSFARGWNPGRAPKDFPNILKDIWWRLDEALTLEDIYFSAIIGLCDSIRCGVTGVIDHHSSQKTVAGSLAEIARAFEETGIKGSSCFELSDRRGPDAFEEGLRETEQSIIDTLSQANFKPMIGMHASMTLSENSLTKISELSHKHNIGCHFHLAEDKCDQDDCQTRYGMRIVQRFAQNDILGPKSLAIHGVHLDNTETELLKESQTNLAICARSNQNNAVGVSRWWYYGGVNKGIGTDGIGSDVFNDAKAALYIAHQESGDPSMGFGEIAEMLIKNNPAIFEKTTGLICGKLAVGYPADMVLWDYHPPTPIDSNNIGGHYLYGLSNVRAKNVYIDGKEVLSNGDFTKVDYPALTARTRVLAQKLWERL